MGQIQAKKQRKAEKQRAQEAREEEVRKVKTHLQSIRDGQRTIDEKQDEIRVKLEDAANFDNVKDEVGRVREEIDNWKETQRQGLAKVWYEREQVSKRIQEANDVLKQSKTSKPTVQETGALLKRMVDDHIERLVKSDLSLSAKGHTNLMVSNQSDQLVQTFVNLLN